MTEMENKGLQRVQGIQVISRAAAILRVLATQNNGMSLGKIAKQVELPRSTVQRIVGALIDVGFVCHLRREAGIAIGPEIQNLARASAIGLRERLSQVMEWVSDATGETVDLAVFEENKMRFIEQVVGSQRLRAVSSIGEMFPLTTTANGKAALSCLAREKATALILDEIGPDKAAVDALLGQLDDIDHGALGIDEDEHTEGLSALGFAVADRDGCIYALSIPVPSSRFRRKKAMLIEAMQKFRGSILAGI